MKFKVIDQNRFLYKEGHLSECTKYFNLYREMWEREGRFLTIEMER